MEIQCVYHKGSTNTNASFPTSVVQYLKKAMKISGNTKHSSETLTSTKYIN